MPGEPTDESLRQWGQNIRLLRELLKPDGELRPLGEEGPVMSQEQLGDLLDPPVAQSTVARWERGQMEPRRHYKAQLAQVLHTDVRLLFSLTKAAVA